MHDVQLPMQEGQTFGNIQRHLATPAPGSNRRQLGHMWQTCTDGGRQRQRSQMRKPCLYSGTQPA